MYFVEDNAADAHDNQVTRVHLRPGDGAASWVGPAAHRRVYVCVSTEPSRGDRGALFLVDVRGDQGGAQALVAAQRQRCGDIPHQWQDSAVSL